jgi:hypothetical protein
VRPAALVFITTIFLASPAGAEPLPWRLSVYGGIGTRLSTSDIFLHGHFHPDGGQIGVSFDRDLANWGAFDLVGEVGATHFVSKSSESTFEVGLGVRYNFGLFSRPVSLAAFTGPSWATGEPTIATGTFHGAGINFKRVPWLNHVGTEIAVGLADNWSGIIRYYHRSGAFGLFQQDADEGSTLGVGLQCRF